MEPHQEAKLDKILEGLSELRPQVADTKSEVVRLRSSVSGLEILQARHGEKLAGAESDINSLGRKVRDHLGNRLIHENTVDNLSNATVRWKLVGAVSGAVLGVFSILVALVKIMHPGILTP